MDPLSNDQTGQLNLALNIQNYPKYINLTPTAVCTVALQIYELEVSILLVS